MVKRSLEVFALAGVLSLSAGFVLAADQERAQDKVQKQEQEQEQIYGSQLMTQQERDEFRAKMRSAKTAKEREQIRQEHHERMMVRAKERGVNLPSETPAHGGHMGSGGGMGAGGDMGSGGGGMGGGRGR
jgi:hypothetical protein